MDTATFTITFDELAGEVGAFLGYGRGVKYQQPEWDSEQEFAIRSCVKAGLHNFYYPAPQPGESAHSWSFLSPTKEFTLASGARTVLLPEDFGGVLGGVFNATTSVCPYQLQPRDKSWIDLEFVRSSSQTGAPRYFAVRAQAAVRDTAEQREELYVFPEADAAYTLRVSYYLVPAATDGTHQHCYGGRAHAQTILESCLAVAEQRLNAKVREHTAAFAQRLAASIGLDRRHQPQQLGQMQGEELQFRDGRWLGSTTVTVNGVTY